MVEIQLQPLLERHEAFWRREGGAALKRVTDHVPLRPREGMPLKDGSRVAEGAFIAPEQVDPGQFGADGPGAAVRGDFIAGASPPHLCWTEAIIGCPVQVVTGGPWAEPFAADWTRPDQLEPDERWLERLDAFVDMLAAYAGGAYPVVQPLMRGPIDMMAAALGHEAMCVALLQEPERSDAFLARCAEIFIATAQRRLDRTPPFAGGYLSGYGIWAPGSVVRTQVDNATMLSPAVYRERVLPHDRRVIEAFDYPLIHLHSASLHIADDLFAIEALKAIQVSLDYPGGPLAAEVLPILAEILKHKPLIVTGPVGAAELEALEGLEPQGGLCLQLELVQEAA
ncbi:MAG: hypothetical protein QGH25_03440 [Candidatus Latescibacteria bacterium]|jgi:hypothetical protein|nr:hypothetical protein [Candidatus Latescibacterota bacterium]